MKIAVIAHYHPDDIWDENFVAILRVVVKVADQIIVVTTSVDISELPRDFHSVVLIRRPNVGYDFYSYRVGMHIALSCPDLDSLFLINSSFFLLNSTRFERLLHELSRDDGISAVRGLTSSSQIGWHIQSYLLYFDFQRIDKKWVENFFSSVKPVNSKLEVVLRYEIGLGQALRDRCIPVDVLFKPTLRQKLYATLGVIRSLVRSHRPSTWAFRTIWRAWREINWSHFGAVILAQRFGIVKAEFLRTNPHKLPTQQVWDACDTELRPSIEKMINSTQCLYISKATGLTELSRSGDPMDIIIETINAPHYRIKNAKIAVVLHLFYLDLFEEILEYLDNILEPFDLFITTPFEGDLQDIIETTNRRCQSVTVVLVKNKGRDVGPFIALFRSGRLNDYDAVLKIHSKKSLYSENGDFWRRELYAPLCGSTLTVLRSLALIREYGFGIIGPSRYYLTDTKFWGANHERLETILHSCCVNVGNEGPKLGFFAGTMFWFAPSALELIRHSNGPSIDFELENGKQDGTLAHAWERAFVLLARAAGYRVSSIDLDGQDMETIDNRQNYVPVI